MLTNAQTTSRRADTEYDYAKCSTMLRFNVEQEAPVSLGGGGESPEIPRMSSFYESVVARRRNDHPDASASPDRRDLVRRL